MSYVLFTLDWRNSEGNWNKGDNLSPVIRSSSLGAVVRKKSFCLAETLGDNHFVKACF